MKIEFRAWHEGEKKMIYQSEVDSFHWFWITPNGNVYRDGKRQNLDLMMYTGFKSTEDKRKLYHKDIVLVPNDDYKKNPEEGQYIIKEIKWDNGMFHIDNIPLYEYCDDITYIGNTYENECLLRKPAQFKGVKENKTPGYAGEPTDINMGGSDF